MRIDQKIKYDIIKSVPNFYNGISEKIDEKNIDKIYEKLHKSASYQWAKQYYKKVHVEGISPKKSWLFNSDIVVKRLSSGEWVAYTFFSRKTDYWDNPEDESWIDDAVLVECHEVEKVVTYLVFKFNHNKQKNISKETK